MIWISTPWPPLVHSCRHLPAGSQHTLDHYWEAEPNENGSSLLYTGSMGERLLCNEALGRTLYWWGWGLRPLCLEWWASCDRRSSNAVQLTWCCRRRASSERRTLQRACRCPASPWGHWHHASDRSFATSYRKCWQRCRPPRMGRRKGSWVIRSRPGVGISGGSRSCNSATSHSCQHLQGNQINLLVVAKIITL